MLDVNNPRVRSLLLKGCFGLEKESLRIDEDGFMSHTPHPFPDHAHIVRDFSENQVEINTPVAQTPEEAVGLLDKYTAIVQKSLHDLPSREYLWPFSNPPYIRNEEDIPIAQFYGEDASKTEYREYLSDRYGRYKMAFSGIHFNYSFSEELLRADFEEKGFDDFQAYKNKHYLELAQQCVAYGWLITAITAASPIMDSSFVEKGVLGQDLFQGLSTVRCSELGYWNFFAPVLDYSSIDAYVSSIQHYIDADLIKYPSELYYPIRIKPKGAYNMEGLHEGVSHIELRMIDLNPLTHSGINIQDVFFCQLFLVWLASTPIQPFTEKDQVQAVQNFKNAAHYDLKTVKIVIPTGESFSVVRAALNVIGFMKDFYKGFPQDVQDCLSFQESKFTEGARRYPIQVREKYGKDFVKLGLMLAQEQQESFLTE